MAVKRFSGSFKTRTDILDNITPNNVVQPNVSVPAGEWKPANWLPVIWQGEASQDNFVISGGKIVCLGTDGRVIPARYRWLAENSTAVNDIAITYTQLDVDQGTVDVTTGVAVTQAAVNAGGTVTMAGLATALLDRGLVREQDVTAAFTVANGDFDVTSVADCNAVLLGYVSAPVGVCAYDVYAWAGDAPGELNFTNYQKQHLIQFFTDVQLQVPVHVLHVNNANGGGGAEDQQTAAVINFTPWVGGGNQDGMLFPDASQTTVAAGGTLTALLVSDAQLLALGRYTAPVTANTVPLVGLALPFAPIASNTDRTAIADGNAALVRQKSSIERVTQAGDFFVDPEVGMIIAADPAGAGAAAIFTANVTYFCYDDVQNGSSGMAGNGAAGERFAHFAGVPRPGTHVTYDLQSNFAPIGVAAATDMDRVVGRLLAVVRQPKGLLDRVRTAFAGANFAKDAQMPGTATQGFTDLITLTDEVAADLVAIINVKVQ
tara:strand:- start:507 stop:1973 length:1467 start_codon:yes stop_codon:yes gene_type:complete